MNSRLMKFLKGPGIIGLMFILLSCQDTIPRRSTISNSSTIGDPTCEEGFTLNEETGECDENPPTRPENAVFFKDDFCICKDNKAYSAGTCASFCSSKATGGKAILYANFNVGIAISLNTAFNNVAGWCNTVLESEGSNAGCELQAKDIEGNIRAASVTNNGNSITADVSDLLEEDKTYQLKLVQKSSPATSDVVQVIRYSLDVTSPTLGILRNAPISQYTCVVKSLTEQTVGNQLDVFSEAAYRIHFYFLPGMAPTAVPAGTNNLVCHDPITNGVVDSEEFPRLELQTDVFRLWDKNDPRFFDNNSNQNKDVNDIIVQKTRNFGATIPTTTNFFAPFTWPGSPTISDQAGNEPSSGPIGFYMAPWIDTNTNLSYCLTATQYNSTNALFRAIGDVVQSDTEGLYVGEKSAETIVINGQNTPGVRDFILVREADLKKVWFYFKNGVLTAPTDANVRSNTIYFYYPFNFTTPFVKSSGQKLFRVRGADELSTTQNAANQSSTDTGSLSVIPPHDRKIGCIPKKAN